MRIGDPDMWGFRYRLIIGICNDWPIYMFPAGCRVNTSPMYTCHGPFPKVAGDTLALRLVEQTPLSSLDWQLLSPARTPTLGRLFEHS
jgi:hypothetical protein